jgi:hypothetical protein
VIAQPLNREFLLDAAEVTRLDLIDAADALARRSDVGPLEDVTVDQIQAVVDELRRLTREEPAERLAPGPGGSGEGRARPEG